MTEGFGGQVAEIYERYRHGYPAEILAAVVDAFALGPRDVAVDLGCGTGQVVLPLAATVRAVVGVDPEPDMLRVARRVGLVWCAGCVGRGGGGQCRKSPAVWTCLTRRRASS